MSAAIHANADYHVLVLAAGCSRRMAHLTIDRPKSLLEVEGKPVIGHSLDILDARGFRRVTFVVGYMADVFMDTVGDRHGEIAIEYVNSADFETTEHGWSLYLTRESWDRERRPVLFMDADNLYDPSMLDPVLHSEHENLVLVDGDFETGGQEEELVLGRGGLVTGLVRGMAGAHPDCVGGFVGINRFSAGFMDACYGFMEPFFARHGRSFKYERIFHRLVNDAGVRLHYALSGGLDWVNINREADYDKARAIAGDIAALRAG